MIINTKRNWIKTPRFKDSDLPPNKRYRRKAIKRFRSQDHLGKPLQLVSDDTN